MAASQDLPTRRPDQNWRMCASEARRPDRQANRSVSGQSIVMVISAWSADVVPPKKLP